MIASKPKVLVAMSGGVDSSVAAALLVREGYEVVGCFMRLGSPGETLDELESVDTSRDREGASNSAEGTPLPDGRGSSGQLKIGKQGCCSINDAADARLVAAKLDIPFYVCNFKKEFGRIIDYFVGEYNAGRTPNPCVRCNDWLKFGKLHEYAKQIDAQFIASGHYARIEHDGDAPCLLRGVDHDKDQSYVLFGAPRERLGEMLLPIGGMKKSRVRELAREFNLPVFDKPDSQEICFVPDNDYAGLVRRRSPDAVEPGQVIDTAGAVLGEHPGHQHFTIGQRRGLGVAAGHPLYVINKDAASNTVVVGEKDDLLATGCVASEANWLVEPPARDEWMPCTAKIRYNSTPIPARVRRSLDSQGQDARATDNTRRDACATALSESIEVQFDEPQEAVAPGQAVVCYDGDVVVCGGWISDVMQP